MIGFQIGWQPIRQFGCIAVRIILAQGLRMYLFLLSPSLYSILHWLLHNNRLEYQTHSLFFDDYANSIAFVYLLPSSFIFGGYYFDYSLKIIEGLLENCKQDRDIINRFKKRINVYNRLAFILEIISIAVAFVIAWKFSHVFKKVDTVIIWSNELPTCKQLAYQIILFLVWCFSLQFGFVALIDCLKLGALLNKPDNFQALHNHYDNCLGYGKCAELVVGHVGLAIYFFLGMLLVIPKVLSNPFEGCFTRCIQVWTRDYFFFYRGVSGLVGMQQCQTTK